MTRTVGPPRVAQGRSRGASAASDRTLWVIGVPLAIGLLVTLASTAIGLYDRIEHWGKLVHAVDGFCAAFIFCSVFLGWRQKNKVDVTDQLSALLAMFFGIFFGVMWEIVEFARDWVAYSDLQKSNNDTMTDFLCNDVAAVIATLLAMRLYVHVLQRAERERMGTIGEYLVDGPSRLLDRHGLTLSVIVVGVIGGTVLTLWFAGRPIPGMPIP